MTREVFGSIPDYKSVCYYRKEIKRAKERIAHHRTWIKHYKKLDDIKEIASHNIWIKHHKDRINKLNKLIEERGEK